MECLVEDRGLTFYHSSIIGDLDLLDGGGIIFGYLGVWGLLFVVWVLMVADGRLFLDGEEEKKEE